MYRIGGLTSWPYFETLVAAEIFSKAIILVGAKIFNRPGVAGAVL